ncbi:uncharacterized protein M6B38_157795 [Iris pallida]|uniref:Uncharacterized protein n=1 Tax=Iris pallida TaxID=29817 RepID=A0AAX6F1A8_IRIPA|nr:uncharacterized protein M6B38_157795 [Iris pallida]
MCPTFRTPRHHHPKYDTSKKLQNLTSSLSKAASRISAEPRAPSPEPTKPASTSTAPEASVPEVSGDQAWAATSCTSLTVPVQWQRQIRPTPAPLGRPPPLGQSSDVSPPPDPALAIPPCGVATVGAFPNACRSVEETSSGACLPSHARRSRLRRAEAARLQSAALADASFRWCLTESRCAWRLRVAALSSRPGRSRHHRDVVERRLRSTRLRASPGDLLVRAALLPRREPSGLAAITLSTGEAWVC